MVSAYEVIIGDRAICEMFVTELYEAVKSGHDAPSLDAAPIRFGSAHHAGVYYLRHLFGQHVGWSVPWRINNLVKYLAQIVEWESGYYAEFTEDDARYVINHALPQAVEWVYKHLGDAYLDTHRPFASPDVLRERGKNVVGKYFHKLAIRRWPEGCYESNGRIMMTCLHVPVSSRILTADSNVRLAADYAIHVPNSRRHNMTILHDALLRNGEYLLLGSDLTLPTVHAVIPIPQGTIHRAEWCFCKVPTSTVNYRDILANALN